MDISKSRTSRTPERLPSLKDSKSNTPRKLFPMAPGSLEIGISNVVSPQQLVRRSSNQNFSKDQPNKSPQTSQSPIRTVYAKMFSKGGSSSPVKRNKSKDTKKDQHSAFSELVKKEHLQSKEQVLLNKVQKLKKEKQELIHMLKKSEYIMSLKLKESKEESSKISNMVRKLVASSEKQQDTISDKGHSMSEQLSMLSNLLKKESISYCENCKNHATISTNTSSNEAHGSKRPTKVSSTTDSLNGVPRDLYNSEIQGLKRSLDISLKREQEYKEIILKSQDFEKLMKEENRRLSFKLDQLQAQLQTDCKYYFKMDSYIEDYEMKCKINNGDKVSSVCMLTSSIQNPISSVLKMLHLPILETSPKNSKR